MSVATLHELPDQQGNADIVHQSRLPNREHAQDTHHVMSEAWRTMTSGRRGPVSVEMCWDTNAGISQFA